jgi:hypothetical protein
MRLALTMTFHSVTQLLIGACLAYPAATERIGGGKETYYLNATTIMNDVISVSFESPMEPALLHGPVKATITVKNLTRQPVEVLLPYPNPNNLAFECKTPGLARSKPVEFEEIGRVIPTAIAAKGSISATYYLNRYLAFLKPGVATVAYRVRILVSVEPRTDRAVDTEMVFEGDFELRLVQASEADLRSHLAMYAARLRSTNRQAKMEAAEALAFLDTPLCVEYLVPMLSIDNLEVIGIRALARFPSPETETLIVGMLSHKDSRVVSAALDTISAQRIQLPRQQVQSLLVSDNANIRLLGLEWLATRPDQTDRQSVSALLSDPNSAVREKAITYIEKLNR